jgi:Protein of unknown function (DUF3617)
MKMNALLGFGFLLALSAWAADSLQPLDVKLGLWESTSTMEHSGTPPIPQELLERLTPEQRAKMEERLKAQQGSKTNARKSCVTKESLDKAMAFGSDDRACHRTIVSSSSTKVDAKIECSAGGMKSTGTVHVDVISSEHVKGTVVMNMGDGTRAMKVNSTFESKWLGPVCGATKED